MTNESNTPQEQTEATLDVKTVKNGQLVVTSTITPDGKVGTEVRTDFEGISLGDLESMVSGVAGSSLGVAYLLARGNQDGVITETSDSRVLFLNILIPAIINMFNNYINQQVKDKMEQSEVKEAEIVNP